MKKNRDIPFYKNVEAFLIMIFMLVLPWITKLKVIKLDDVSSKYFQNTEGYIVDVFLYCKSIIVITMAVLIIVMIVGENIFPDNVLKNTPVRYKGNIKFLICVLVYIVMTIISAAFSKYTAVVKSGSPSEFESAYVLISYMVIFVGGMNYFCYESVCKCLKNMICILMSITIILNCVEFFYKPLLEIPFVKIFISSKEYRYIADTLQVTQFTDMTSLTFYNPNYYGGFCLLLLPFSLVFFLGAKGMLHNVIYGILSSGMIFSILCARSSASFYLMIMEIIVIATTYFIKVVKSKSTLWKWCKILVVPISTAIILLIVNIFTHGKIYDVSKNIIKNTSYSVDDNKGIFLLSDIKIEENKLNLISDSHTLTIEVKDNNLSFYDENGQVIQAIEKDGSIHLNAEFFDMISVSVNSYKQIVVDAGYKDGFIFYISDGRFYGVGQDGSMIDNVSITNRKGQQFYSLFTGRGYMWVNTIPLLKNTFICGHGAGTFSFYFPQNDYVGLANTHGSSRFVIDKPHNMYLQTAVEEGCIVLAAVVILIILVVINYTKSISAINASLLHNNNYLGEIAAASIVSIIAFAIYSLFNDSMVTVNPIFWLLLGINISSVYGINLQGGTIC